MIPDTPIPVRSAFSRLDYGSLTLRPVVLLALLSELTRLAPSQRGRLHPGFRRFGHPPRRRISLQCQLGNLHWQDFHLLDHQLASLHYPHLHVLVSEGGLQESKGRWIARLEYGKRGFIELMHAWRYAVIAYLAQALKGHVLTSELSAEELRTIFESQYKRGR